MTTYSRKLLATASLLVLSCTYAERPITDNRGYEIIVKFSAAHSINDNIAKAFGDTAAEASLNKPIQGLSTELGVPFTYSRLTSGREIIIEVPAAQVYQRVLERIRDSSEVKNATLEKPVNDSVANEPIEVLITLDSGKIKPGRGIDADVLAAHLVDDERFPVFCEIRSDGRLAVTPDFDRIVEALVRSLASRADIDYAQANYRVRHYENAR